MVSCSIGLYNSGTVSLYINGVQFGSKSGYLMNNVVRTTNYIGRSNWIDPNINAVLDEIKIFNRPLTVSEICTEMNKPQPVNIIKL